MNFKTDIKRNTWISKLPQWMQPYAYIARWDRPTGVWLLLMPSLWSIAAATEDLDRLVVISVLFLLGAILMRGAGCVINDMADEDIDKKVERTKGRPLASGQLSFNKSLVFLVIQLSLAFMILTQFNRLTIILGIASLGLVVCYPFMKRITHWPQAFLGLTMNWGILMGWAAVNNELSLPALILYGGSFFWTMGYDTIYGHMDRKNDLMLGVKSTSILLGKATKWYVSIWYTIFFICFFVFGVMTSMGGVYFLGASFVMVMLLYQVLTLDIKNPAHCLRLFKINGLIGFVAVLSTILGK